MNLDKFSNESDGFAVLDFRAEFQWKTSSSISFTLCCYPASNVRRGIGWIDVHETDEDWRRIKIRICVPHDVLKFGDLDKAIEQVLVQLSLPNDSYEATFISPSKQIVFDTGCDHEFVSYGVPYEAGDNPWDDRDGVSPLEIVSREAAFAMLLTAFPGFHQKADEIQRSGIKKLLGEQFLDLRETLALVDAVVVALGEGDHLQLRRLFEVLERLAKYGDHYTRNASLPRLFELMIHRVADAKTIESFLQPKTLEIWNTASDEIRKRASQ